jgi:hypothetical protein
MFARNFQKNSNNAKFCKERKENRPVRTLLGRDISQRQKW